MQISMTNKLKKPFSKNVAISYLNKLVENIHDKITKLRDLSETNYLLGLHHLRLQNMSDAELRFRIVLFLKPNHPDALYQLAKCLFIRNQKSKALINLNKSLALKSDFPEAEYLLCIITNKNAAKSIPTPIIEDYFNAAADKYNDDFNIKNGYTAAKDLITEISKYLDHKKIYSILDLGCGTGQCGVLMSQNFSTAGLYGVDISENMLNIASATQHIDKPLYKKLVHQDYHSFLAKTKNKYDIIVAGLSIHYKASFFSTLKEMASVLSTHGHIAFSVEKSSNDNSDAVLNKNFENFCYNESFIKNEIKKAGLKCISIKQTTIRNEIGAFVCICTK